MKLLHSFLAAAGTSTLDYKVLSSEGSTSVLRLACQYSRFAKANGGLGTSRSRPARIAILLLPRHSPIISMIVSTQPLERHLDGPFSYLLAALKSSTLSGFPIICFRIRYDSGSNFWLIVFLPSTDYPDSP